MDTHEYVEEGLASLHVLLAGATPEAQPSGDVLRTFVELVKLHREGVPGVDYDEQLEEMRAELDALKSEFGAAQVMGVVKVRKNR